MTGAQAAIAAALYVVGLFGADIVAREIASASAAGYWPRWLHVGFVVLWPVVVAAVLVVLAAALVGWLL